MISPPTHVAIQTLSERGALFEGHKRVEVIPSSRPHRLTPPVPVLSDARE